MPSGGRSGPARPPFVIDANTLVSAALTEAGIPERAIAAARRIGDLVMSATVFAEISAVLHRPKLQRAISAERRASLLEVLAAASTWLTPLTEVRECRDPKDNIYLVLAAASGAAALLTRDPWRGVRIVKPAEFLALVGAQHPSILRNV